jgi:hypothetical protein
MDIRCIVTGRNDTGKSAIVRDSSVQPVNEKPLVQSSERGGQPGNSRSVVFPTYCRSAMPILLV